MVLLVKLSSDINRHDTRFSCNMVCLQLFLRTCPHQTFPHYTLRTQDYKQYTNTTNEEQTIKTDSKQYTAKEDLIAVCGRLCVRRMCYNISQRRIVWWANLNILAENLHASVAGLSGNVMLNCEFFVANSPPPTVLKNNFLNFLFL